MKLLLKILLTLFAVFQVSCANGPKVTSYVSNLIYFDGSDWRGHKSILAFADSDGYAVYPPLSFQALFNYCGLRKSPDVQVPVFDSCVSDVTNKGFSCVHESCSFIPAMTGISCIATGSYFVTYDQSANYEAFSPPDNQTLLSFCDVKLVKQ